MIVTGMTAGSQPLTSIAPLNPLMVPPKSPNVSLPPSMVYFWNHKGQWSPMESMQKLLGP